MAKARLVGINHVALEVGDLDAALDLYGRLFGFELRGRVPGMAFLDMGDQFLAVAEGRAPGRTTTATSGSWSTTATRCGGAARGRDQAAPRQRLRFTDPWGNEFEIVEYADVQFTKAPRGAARDGARRARKTEEARAQLAEKGLLG